MKMKDLSMHGEDPNGFDVSCDNQEVVVVGKEDEEIWFETASQHQKNHQNNDNNNNNNNNNNNININIDDDEFLDPSSLFYAEFPVLPDFPFKSSSSSSSSNRVPSKRFMKSTTATSSSASTASSGTASWAMVKSDADHDQSSASVDTISYPENQTGMVIGDLDQCMDMMEDFGCMDLLDQTSDICWDPSPLFEDHQRHESEHQRLMNDDNEEHVFRPFMLQNESDNNNNDSNNNNSYFVDLGQSSGGVKQESSPSSATDELAMVFFEWLKTNKEIVSAEDLRNIKIKKSTIERAAKRLGGGKEGMKQLLKLILQWVQNHHLHTNPNPNVNDTSMSLHVNLSPSHNPALSCMNNPSSWLTPQLAPDVGPMLSVGPSSGFTGNMCGDPYGSGYPPPIPGSDYHSWAKPGGPLPYGMGMGVGPYGSFPDPVFGGYGAGYPAGYYYHPGPVEGLVRLGSSATKEARKKRMARQRRFLTHHHRSHSHHNNHHSNNPINPTVEMNGGVGNANCGVVAPNPSHSNWVYWSHPQLPPVPPTSQVNHLVTGSGPVVGQMALAQERVGISGFPRQVVGGVEKKQGWKNEKNLRFLLQKVLKQSDVGNLGRIVLPKKEAEMHLPELEARDGIPIAMEDIGTSRVWNMRYRFWPNNKSRMYLLENTGDFVKTNGLQEGDFIVIYSDVKCGKYMIRGVKVRPQLQGAKSETTIKTNKPSKTQKTQGFSTPAGNSPTTQHMI